MDDGVAGDLTAASEAGSRTYGLPVALVILFVRTTGAEFLNLDVVVVRSRVESGNMGVVVLDKRLISLNISVVAVDDRLIRAIQLTGIAFDLLIQSYNFTALRFQRGFRCLQCIRIRIDILSGPHTLFEFIRFKYVGTIASASRQSGRSQLYLDVSLRD